MTDMASDVRVKRLIRNYGVEGYGLYNYILERIVARLETESPYPDLEENAADIASDLRMDTLRVEEIMRFCINQGMFEHDEALGRLVASKIYKFLEQRETRSEKIREMIKAYKSCHEAENTCRTTVGTDGEEQNRTEQNRLEHSASANADLVIDYLNEQAGKQYRHSETSRKPIRARIDEGYTVEDCRTVVDTKVSQWQGTDMDKFLRPETLFRPSKFESYLNERPAVDDSPPDSPEPIVDVSKLGGGNE
jgi:uncharacterized phage protein (TIGR02220 family)